MEHSLLTVSNDWGVWRGVGPKTPGHISAHTTHTQAGPYHTVYRRMRLSTQIDRRQALLRTLVSLSAGRLSLEAAQPAFAITRPKYSVVPSGSIADKETMLAEATKKFEVTPDDPYVFGEKAQLECVRPKRAVVIT